MAPSGDEIRRRLGEFAARWGGYHGSERAEAQTFLTQLLACYDIDRQEVGARFEDRAGGGFMDMIWDGVCIVEMKRPSEARRLDDHREQAFEYWKRSGKPGAPAPPYVVVCAFHRFQVYKPDEGWDRPQADFELAELPEHRDALAFLAGQALPSRARPFSRVMRSNASRGSIEALEERLPEEADVVRDFVLQCVWVLFAEDLGMLQAASSADLLDRLIADPGRSSRTSWVNSSGISQLPANDLRTACTRARRTWTVVSSSVPPRCTSTPRSSGFCERRHRTTGRASSRRSSALCSRERSARSVSGPRCALHVRGRHPQVRSADGDRAVAGANPGPRDPAELEAAERDFRSYVVLDPACGSGNFLYVAYRNLRRLEVELHERGHEIRSAAGLHDPDEPVYSRSRTCAASRSSRSQCSSRA